MILGTTGTHGAGKSTVVAYLVEKKGFKLYSVSDKFLTDEAVRRGLTPDRVTRGAIANEFRAISPTALMEAVLVKAKDDIAEGLDIIVDPQYTKEEVEYIKEQGGIEIAVDADLPIRFERIQKRGSAKDNITYEEFKERQIRELVSPDPTKQNLAGAIEHADYHILNNGSVEELYAEVDALLEKITDR